MSKELNNLLPFDELHWNEEEGKFVALSEEKMDALIDKCLESGVEDLSEVLKVIRWAEKITVGQILLKRLIRGEIVVGTSDEDDIPRFHPNKN